jgi:hypothetical protein
MAVATRVVNGPFRRAVTIIRQSRNKTPPQNKTAVSAATTLRVCSPSVA